MSYGSQKERIATINNLQLVIYSNDHNPPHFHVISRDRSIDAKFRINDGSYLSGEISERDIKKVKTFHSDIKVQAMMRTVWSKKQL